jgi:hypothetical protein
MAELGRQGMNWTKRAAFFAKVVFTVFCWNLAVPVAAQTNFSLDDIYVYYHGVALDKDRRLIEINEERAKALFAELVAEANEGNRSKNAIVLQLKEYLRNLKSNDAKKEIDALDFGVGVFLSENDNDPVYQLKIMNRLKMVRSVTGRGLERQLLPPEGLTIPLAERLRSWNEKVSGLKAVRCADDDVPKPPGFKEFMKTATKKVPLSAKHSFMLYEEVHKAYPTDIYFLQTSPPHYPRGMCALLVRYQKADPKPVGEDPVPGTVAAICQSEETGHACFWQANLSSKAKNWIANYLTVNDDIVNQWPMGQEYDDTCTACHIGRNAFIQYRGSELCFPNFSSGNAESSCYNLKDKETTVAVGFAKQPEKFEPKFSVPKKNDCTSCHSIETTDRIRFCKMLKFVVTEKIMPPIPVGPLDWAMPNSGNAHLDASVNELREEFCYGLK